MKRALPGILVAAILGLSVRLAAGAMLAPGDPFPAWKLRDQGGREVSSESYAGKTYLVWFYPKAMTAG